MSTTEADLQRAWQMAQAFQPGLYEHYKGGRYVALGIVVHHDTRMPMVEYVSLTYGSRNVRPLVGWDGDPDGWADTVGTGLTMRRFEWIGTLPSNVPWKERGIP